MAHGSAEGAEDCGKGLLYCVGDLVIGAAGVRGEWREGDGKGAGSQIGRGRPAVGDGEDDGALEEELERLAVAGLAAGGTHAAGEGGEGGGGLRGGGGARAGGGGRGGEWVGVGGGGGGGGVVCGGWGVWGGGGGGGGGGGFEGDA